MKVVYAACGETGIFDELVVLDTLDVISDDHETEEGVFVCQYDRGGGIEEFYYLDKRLV